MRRSKKLLHSTPRKKIKSKSAPDEPFAPKVLKQARHIAGSYRVVIEPGSRGGFVGWSIEMPGVLADGRTAAECTQATYEALEMGVATLLERGERPPTPRSKRGKRTAQVNFRVSTAEKLILEEAAHRRGFEGVSDFIRATALRESGIA